MKRYVAFLILLLSCSFIGIAQDDYKSNSRLNYYTHEDIVAVAVWIPASKQELSVSVDIVFEFDYLASRVDVRAGETSIFELHVDRFHPGNNELTVSYNEQGKWVGSDKVQIKLLDGTANEVKIDFVNGKLLTKGSEKGIRMNYNILNLAGGIGPGHEDFRNYKPRKRMKKLRKEVMAMKDDPALLSWNISYDPQGQNIDAEDLAEAYELIKELDPYHPVTITFISLKDIAKYKPVMDVVQLEEGLDISEKEFFLEKPVLHMPIK